MITYQCGCANEHDCLTGVLRCSRKCFEHLVAYQEPKTLDLVYYTRLEVLEDGKMKDTRHVAELEEAARRIPDGCGVAIEVGCGVSPYAKLLTSRGYDYVGIDDSSWAVRFMQETVGVRAVVGSWPGTGRSCRSASLVLAAHVLEHLPDAPNALAAMYDVLAPGGLLYVIVPDDSDPVNPDHLWFFTPDTLTRLISWCGFVDCKVAVRKIVPHENFLYATARKP